MSLSDLAARRAKAGDRPVKLSDEKGLYLLVHPNGSKYWRLKYRIGGKEKLLALGVYPDVSLADARDKRDQARKMLANGADPGAVKKAAFQAGVLAKQDSLKAVGLEWFSKFSSGWAASHADVVRKRLERDVFPWLGSRPIREIIAPELLTVIRRIEARGAVDTAHRALQNCGQILRYAVATGRAERDCSGDLRGALPPAWGSHYPAITDPKAIGDLLRSMDGYEGDLVTRCALKLAPLVFVRPGELRHAEWSEIETDAATWSIPANKMKQRRPHMVPLSRQAVVILQEIQPLTGAGRYVFPGVRTPARPMSNNTINAALRRLGYSKKELTGHGFRSMASTVLNELGWNRDVIERQLAHAESNAVRAAYNRAEWLPERRKMMQAWADYLDGLKADGNFSPLKRIG